CQWGNLAAMHDESAVDRLDEYYRRRLIYRMTPAGEAADAAVRLVEQAATRTGALQGTMLDKIVEALDQLAALAPTTAEPDVVKRALDSLHMAFDSLTTEASRFIGELQARLGAGAFDAEVFARRKQALVAYLQSFVGRLSRLADPIRRKVALLTPRLDALLAVARASSDLPPDLSDEGAAGDAFVADQRARWAGVQAWFAPTDGDSTERALMRVAEQSVSELVHTLHRLRNRVTRRVDRAADFRQLARWFADCDDDSAAHALFARAFGLHPARHFHLAEDDDELASPKTSWWHAQPVSVPVYLRRRGQRSAAGRCGHVIDLSERHDWLRAVQAQARADRQAALRALGDPSGPRKASTLGCLEASAFALFCELLGAALDAPANAEGWREGRSEDGRFAMRWRPVAGSAPVTVVTEAGRFGLPVDAEFIVKALAG
ncbi:MAG: TIGR02677 family protein, partial [Myxococcales bacterium]|nr:TIGR02677 family protein [Myxococcales bacterium]